VNQLGQARVQTVRSWHDRIGENLPYPGVQGPTIPRRAKRAEFLHRLGRSPKIATNIYQLTFLAKFLHNSINQLTPFYF